MRSNGFLRPFSAPFDSIVRLTKQPCGLRFKIGARYEIDISIWTPWARAGGEPEESYFKVLQGAMNATLRETKLVFARAPGVVRVRTWISGRPAAGGPARTADRDRRNLTGPPPFGIPQRAGVGLGLNTTGKDPWSSSGIDVFEVILFAISWQTKGGRFPGPFQICSLV